MKKQPKFVVFQDSWLDWRWHLVAGNGRVICQGESHGTEQHARRAVDGVIRAAACAVVRSNPVAPAGKPVVKKATR